ncbi:hypothetical protein M569_13048, partial [Genlisea aurea]
MHVDGSTLSGVGAGIQFKTPYGDFINLAVKFCFSCTNNVAEYEALLAGMTFAYDLGVRHMDAYSDSQLVVEQFHERFLVKEPTLEIYLTRLHHIASKFKEFTLTHIPREVNKAADALARLAASFPNSQESTIIVQVQGKPTVAIPLPDRTEDKVYLIGLTCCPIDRLEVSWMTPLEAYLARGELPADHIAARLLKEKAKRYSMVGSKLYRRSSTGAMLVCVTPAQATLVLEEIHKGVCGNHPGPRSLALRAKRAGYYWPTLMKDAVEYVR